MLPGKADVTGQRATYERERDKEREREREREKWLQEKKQAEPETGEIKREIKKKDTNRGIKGKRRAYAVKRAH